MIELTLKNIADWQLNPTDESFPSINGSKIVAGIPSLQRGAVWEAQQIEMLWDSIFRGFPFGSIVLAKKIEGQRNKSSQVTGSANENVEYHLLDGQQRCNAIAWGFANPWRDTNVSSDQIFWLDLSPENRLTKTSKKFLFRVTTKAHPWGFQADEQSTKLTVQQIRESMKSDKRPETKAHLPYDAGCPVPLCYLLEYYQDDAIAFSSMLEKMKDDGCPIPQFSDDFVIEENILAGLKIASEARVNYLLAPDLTDGEGIDAIEQIFIRLNRQGTPLDQEELAYSMIKAYWPAIEQKLSALTLKHTTDARLVYMLIRAKRSKDGKLAGELGVDQIRLILKGQHKNIEATVIPSYFENKEDKSIDSLLSWIDANLVYSDKRPYGMPKYLRSSIAWTSKQVFTWWLVLAETGIKLDEEQAKRIIWLSLAVHWFGEDKEACVNLLLSETKESIDNLVNFDFRNFNKEPKKRLIRLPLSPDQFDAAIKLSDTTSDDHFKQWTSFWQGIVKLDKGGNKNAEDAMVEEGLFFEKLKDLREMLVYSQRSYIEDSFEDFDPSNKLMWKGYNRPWDYDHILPSNALNAQGKSGDAGEYHEVCKVWQNSIGNLIAVDFSLNREWQDKTSASEKYGADNKKDLCGCFRDIKLESFEMDLGHTQDSNKSREFVLAAYQRMKNIYSEWWDRLKIQNS